MGGFCESVEVGGKSSKEIKKLGIKTKRNKLQKVLSGKK